MGRAKRAAATGNELYGVGADEADEAIIIGLVSGHDMMMEGDAGGS
jgi:hypothetical protein